MTDSVLFHTVIKDEALLHSTEITNCLAAHSSWSYFPSLVVPENFLPNEPLNMFLNMSLRGAEGRAQLNHSWFCVSNI